MSERDEDKVVERICADLEIVGFRPMIADAFNALRPGDPLPGGLVVVKEADIQPSLQDIIRRYDL
jgi:hypothetical protein